MDDGLGLQIRDFVFIVWMIHEREFLAISSITQEVIGICLLDN